MGLNTKTRPTVAVIDTGALRFNYRQLKKTLPRGTELMAVVKANAYGHGDAAVARALSDAGCRCFGVAIVEEGARLRASGIKGEIVVLGGIFAGQVGDIFAHSLTPVVFDISTARAIDRFAGKAAVVKRIHVKIDTGMGRLGLLPCQVTPFFTALKKCRNVKVDSVLSHFAEAEAENGSFSKKQLELFLKAVDTIKGLGFSPGYIGMANSAAIVDFNASHLLTVRPGIMLYGAYPSPRLKAKIRLKPVMELKTGILHVKEVGSGFPVSYGGTFVTKRASLIATLPIGYADGISRRLSNNGEVLIRGKRAPIAGKVCMDLIMCDVTGIKGVKAGDEAVIIGRQGKERITAEDVAEKTGTISYEVFCNISSRVPRVYI